jgi:hypothetical protein
MTVTVLSRKETPLLCALLLHNEPFRQHDADQRNDDEDHRTETGMRSAWIVAARLPYHLAMTDRHRPPGVPDRRADQVEADVEDRHRDGVAQRDWPSRRSRPSPSCPRFAPSMKANTRFSLMMPAPASGTIKLVVIVLACTRIVLITPTTYDVPIVAEEKRAEQTLHAIAAAPPSGSSPSAPAR